MNITLTGPRAIGKTTIGRLLAKELKLKFIDHDDYAEKFFKDCGGIYGFVKKYEKKSGTKNAWAKYHQAQSKVLKDIFNKEGNIVLSVGGAIFAQPLNLFKTNRRIIRKNSKVISLLAYKDLSKCVALLVQRELERNYNKRSKKEEVAKRVERDYKSIKKDLEKKADLIIYTQSNSPNKIVKEIIKRLK